MISITNNERSVFDEFKLWRKNFKLKRTKLDRIINNLYISNYNSANDIALLNDYKIEAIVTLSRFPLQSINNGIRYFHLPIIDLPDTNVKSLFEKVNYFIHYHRLIRKNVLVHCTKGISRSACFVIAYLMSIEPKLSYPDALAFVELRHPISRPNDGFKQQLEEFDKAPKSDLESMSCLAKLDKEFAELKKSDSEFFENFFNHL